jgi:cholestenol delta-isomerase
MASESDLFGQLWKEYSLSDSRYLTQDSFVVCMEAITAAFWGPMSFACAYFIVTDHPLRHPFQLTISLGQLYGDILYYATAFFSDHVYGTVYYRPESYYFWWYFVLCNAFWIVIPGKLIWDSFGEIAHAAAVVKASKQVNKRK